MLPSEHRMRRRDEFTQAVRRGRRAGRPNVVVHLLRTRDGEVIAAAEPTERAEPVRVGFIVARTVGNAVVRNRVKRRLRHIVARHVHRLPAGSLLVVRANPRAASARHDELAADVESGLDRLLRPHSKGRTS